MAIVEAALLRCEVLIEDLAVIADTAENQAVAVNAIRAQIRSTDHQLALLRDAGVLPMPLSRLAQHFDAERAASHATEVLDRHRVPANVKRELVAALRGSRHPTHTGRDPNSGSEDRVAILIHRRRPMSQGRMGLRSRSRRRRLD